MTDSEGQNCLVIDFDTNIFRLTAIKKAAYKFGDRCFIQIDAIREGTARVVLKPKSVADRAGVLEGAFRNEVLDQELREVIQDETIGVRNILLAQAFSATSLTDPVGDSADHAGDPLRIRQSHTNQ